MGMRRGAVRVSDELSGDFDRSSFSMATLSFPSPALAGREAESIDFCFGDIKDQYVMKNGDMGGTETRFRSPSRATTFGTSPQHPQSPGGGGDV